MTYTREPHYSARPIVEIRPPDGALYPSFKRRFPDRVFYTVPALMWLVLAMRHRSLTLPSAANPSLDAGGLWGESKSQGLHLFGPSGQRVLPPFVTVDCTPGLDRLAAAMAALSSAGMQFPVVGKPDRGYQGWGVRVLHTMADLADYLAKQSDGARILLQSLIDLPGEAGVFYIRYPGSRQGRIVSLALVYPPHVIGDGVSTMAALVARDPILRANAAVYRQRSSEAWNWVLDAGRFHCLTNARSARLGAVYRNATDQITSELEEAIDRISREIPDFHFGRFDIRFRNLEDLLQGKGFRVVELNGAGAEMLHIWAGTGTLGQAWRTLWRQYRDLFSIGAAMRRQGHQPVGLRGMIRLQRQQERLRRGYPPSS